MTTGLVSVVFADRVLLKIVVGCEGQRAEYFSEALRHHGEIPSRRDAYGMARRSGLGCKECLVVMDREGVEFKGEGSVPPLYRRSFNRACFSPEGSPDFMEVVEL